MRINSILVTLVLGASVTVLAQQEQNRANWSQFEQYSSAALQKYVYSWTVRPNWINDSDRFWYRWTDASSTRFVYVDPAGREKRLAFDHDKLAAALSELGKKPSIGRKLPFTKISYNEEETIFTFIVGEQHYEWHLKDETLKAIEKEKDKPEPQMFSFSLFSEGMEMGGDSDPFSMAPDELNFAYMLGWNLYVGKKENKEDKIDDVEAEQITTDGKQFDSFQSWNYMAYKRGDEQKKMQKVFAKWSEDSEAFAISRIDAVKVKDLWVINELANPRPTLETYKYQMPGEKDVQQTKLFVYTKDGGLVHVPAEKYTDQEIRNVHWTGEDHDVLRFIRRDRLQRNQELCEYDLETGEIKVLITESVEGAHIERKSVEYAGKNNTGDIIWWSERTGWGHFYRYSHDGEFKNSITKGAWRAEGFNGVDEDGKRIWYRAVGTQPGENLYNVHYFSIGLDGKGLRHLTNGNAHHLMNFSESKKFSVDAYSRVDLIPSSVVRDDRGKTIMDLETMDLSKLKETGWKQAEQTTIKSADGFTELYANIWKPYDFDPNKKYPVILEVYPGPTMEALNNFFFPTGPTQELAQLGFIVIQIGNRGGTSQRDNVYHSYGYNNLRDYGLADKKAGVEELARRYSWIDIDKVGIYGHSGGGFMTAAAMLLPPYNDFFKVGVSSAGNHDNNIYNANWFEQYHGLKVKEAEEKKEGVQTFELSGGGGSFSTGSGGQEKVDEKSDEDKKDEKKKEEFEIRVPTNIELAKNLKGKLLIVHGTIDENVHPSNSIRLIDALIKAGKRFDMMMMPGQGHGYGQMSGYFRQMQFEYFARHLMGDTYDGSAEIADKGK